MYLIQGCTKFVCLCCIIDIMNNSLVSMKEYAEQHGVSYEAVRRQVALYKTSSLKGHIVVENRKQYLDEYAIVFLNNHRFKNAISITHLENKDELCRLREENNNLLKQIAALQQQIINEKENNIQLQNKVVQMLEIKSTNKDESVFSRLFKKKSK